jgi:cytidylate kinase
MNMQQGSLLVVTGPPAAGKTTLARLLTARRPLSVHLHADDFWGFIANGYIDPWLPESHHQNEVVMRGVCRTAATFAAGSYDVVLDGVLGPWFLPELAAAGGADELDVHYVVLLPPLGVALQNLAGRTGHGFTSAEAAAKMHAEFTASVVGLDRHVIDPTRRAPDALADDVDARLAAGQLRLAGERG